MSQLRRFNFGLMVVLIMTSFFVFGCNKSTPVNDIAFNIEGGEQIVLMVGQEFDLDGHIEINPSYATNKKFSVSSFDSAIVRVENTKLVAVNEGNTQIRVVSDDNPLKEDLMSVVVKKVKTQLNAPLNLRYDNVSRSFSFDPVTYAASYTIKINGTAYNLGNSTTFNMNQHAGKLEDELIVAQVKANAPSYSFALESSGFSSEYKSYQAGSLKNVEVKAGILSFEKPSSSLAVRVYVNDMLLENKRDGSTVSLKNLATTYAGTTIKVDVESVVGDDIKTQLGNDVEYFSAIKQSVDVNVLDAVAIEYASNSILWANVNYSNGYAIFVDGDQKCIINTNHYDLTDLEDYDDIFNDGNAHVVKVEPLIGNDSVNVAKTTIESSINIKRLEETEIRCDRDLVEWDAVEFASYYVVTLENGGNKTVMSMTDVSLNMAEYTSGEYKILVEAFPGLTNGDIAYLSSEVVEFDFDKQEAVVAEINNYILTVTDQNNDSYKIDFDIDEYDQSVVVASSGAVSIDLIDYNFPAGEHTITITRLGNENKIQSDSLVLDFIQLEAIENIAIQNGEAQVDRSSTNQDAVIKLVTTGSDFSYESVGESVVFNTTDTSNDDTFMKSGDYEVSVFVIGDGKNTFSYRVNGDVVASKTVEINVLPITEISITDPSQEKLTISEIEGASAYKIFQFDGENISELSTVYGLVCDFELESGNIKFAIQTLGDGSTTLDSVVSEFISVSRLETSELIFNNETNKLSIVEKNDDSIVDGYLIKKDGTEIIDDITISFDLKENTSFVLTTIALDGSDGVYYLNSQPYTLELTKIAQASDIKLDENNNLVVEAEGHEKEYNLVLKFDLNGSIKEFKTDATGLTDGSTILNCDYSNGTYLITIIDNFNTIIEGMGDNFSVEVQFVEPHNEEGDSLINSEIVSADLTLVHLDNTITVTTNESNQIVISAPNLGKECGIIVNFFNDDDSFTFTSEANENERNLILESTKLEYTYDNLTYYINTTNSTYDFLHEIFEHDFKIEVKFTHLLNSSTLTDLDSAFAGEIQIYVQAVSDITRIDGTQNLEFTKANETDSWEDYSFLITDVENGENFIFNLSEGMVQVDDGSFVADIKHFYDAINTKGWGELKVYSISSITLNVNEDPLRTPMLSNKGEEIYIQKSPTIELYTTKDNNNKHDNSVIINFEAIETLFNKEYIVEIYNEGGANKITQTRDDDDIVNNVISISVDQFKMLGTIYVKAYVKTTANYTDVETIEAFNSNYSNELTLIPVATVSNLEADGTSITFDEVENAVGYEVYSVYHGVYTKLNESLLTTTSFEIKETGTKQIVIKTISEVGYSNSGYSEAITINKPKAPTITIENGKFVIDLTSSLEIALLYKLGNVKVQPEVVNGEGIKKTIDLDESEDDIQIISIIPMAVKIVMEPSLFLSYNTAKVSKETLTVTIRFDQDGPEGGVYYLDVDPIEIDSYGLFEPLNVTKATDGDTKVETISWNYNTKNHLFKNGSEIDLKNNVGYVLKIKHIDNGTENIYYTDDDDYQLRYYDAATGLYKRYDKVIGATGVVFPAGYSTSEEYLDVKFDSGRFEVYVKTVPLSDAELTGISLCNSKYSEPCIFDMLDKISLTMSEGNVAWEPQDGAGSYEISILKKGEAEPVKEVIKTPYYDFSTKSTFTDGIYEVVVKALGKNTSVLNSVPSEPMLVYKLPETNEITIDDGNIIVNSTRYFSKIKLEFVDKTTGITIEQYYDNAFFIDLAMKYLKDHFGVESWEGFTQHSEINNNPFLTLFEPDDAVLDIVAGNNYEINVTLIGNSDASIAFASSTKTISMSDLIAAKLKANVNEVSSGTIQFTPNTEYATITKESGYVYQNHIDINYIFNNVAVESSQNFWKTTAVYRIDILCGEDGYTIFAVDYFSIVNPQNPENKIPSEYFIYDDDHEGLYGYVKYDYGDGSILFNVFENNIINLKDFDYLHYYMISPKIENGEVYYENVIDGHGEAKIKAIDLNNAGSIFVMVSMLGGENYTDANGKNVGYLSSSINDIELFIRYEINQITTHEGKVGFTDIKAVVNESDGNGGYNPVVIDYPIYQIVATPANPTEEVKTFYLYYNTNNNSLDIAKLVVKNLLGGTEPEDKWFIELEYAKDVENLLLFNLSEHIKSGNHYVTIRTIAGASLYDSDYFLNSKISNSYPVQKLNDVSIEINDGLLEFKQAYVTDGVNYIYSEDYEITIIDEESNEYSFLIGARDISIDNSGAYPIVRYELPAHIEIEGEAEPITIQALQDYQIKIKALSKVNPVINGTYAKNEADGSDKTLTIEKYQTVEGVKIENGVLVWTHPSGVESILVRIKLTDEEQRNIYIRKTINISDGKFRYDFGDIEYDYSSEGIGKTQILSDIKYSLSIQVIGNSGMLNSSYSEVITVERLQKVKSESIKTLNGNLTWSEVEGAIKYEVNIKGVGSYLSTSNEFNASDLNLLAGTYNINIRAIGDEFVTSLLSDTVQIVQLDTVDIGTIKFEGKNIVWDKVEGANAYHVIFIYSGGTIEDDFDENCLTAPDGMTGRFTLQIKAISEGEGREFNSQLSQLYEGNVARPKPVTNETRYNSDTRSIEIYVDNDDFASGDIILVQADLQKYSNNELDTGSDPEKFEFKITRANDKSHYSVPLKTIALYKEISISIQRAGTMSSDVYTLDDVNFNLFAQGDGSEGNPYAISSSEQLFNIKHFLSDNFNITTSITIDLSKVESYNGIITNKTFEGKIEGQGMFLKLTNNGSNEINLTDVANFSLFKKVTGTISNLIIGDDVNKTIITNTLTLAGNNIFKSDVTMAILAEEASGANITDVQVKNIKIKINSNDEGKQYGNKLNIAGLIYKIDNNSTIGSANQEEKANIGVEVEVNIKVSPTSGAGVNIAGVAISSKNSTIENYNITFTVSSDTNLTKIAGAVAEFGDAQNSYSKISNVNVDFNADGVMSSYVGGLIADAKSAEISNCETSGSYEVLGINYATYIAGLVGDAYCVNISNSATTIEFKITLSNIGDVAVGAIVGYIAGESSDNPSTITNCSGGSSANGGKTDIQIENELTVGVYGRKDGNTVTIQ